MSVGMESLITAEPHFIPGYTGYCPQYRFSCGETYASATHKLLLDRADTLILSDRVPRDCEKEGNEISLDRLKKIPFPQLPRESDVDVVNARFKRTDPVFVHPMLPGYEGFIPRLDARIGQRYTVLATEGLAEFEREQLRNKDAMNQLRRAIDEQSERSESRTFKERPLVKSHCSSALSRKLNV